MKRTLLILIALLSVIGVLAGTLSAQSKTSPPLANDRASTPRGVKTVVSANNRFAFDLYARLSKSGGNIFYSPYSISSALAMVYEGANGKTANQIGSVFYFPKKSILGPNFASVYNGLNRHTANQSLKTGNALWVQKNFPLLKNYTKRIKSYYGGRATNLDFVAKPDESRQTINTFIANQTNNKIKDLLPPGALDAATRLVITNAIYFKGDWKWQFDASETHEGNFKVTPKNIIKTQMMYMKPDKASFRYVNTGKLQVLALPYKGGRLSMLIVLPKKNLASIGSLTASKFKAYKARMRTTHLDSITIPKFELKTSYSLDDVLGKLGMPVAFSGAADFSKMDGRKDLFISAVFHKAYVKVDEKGTEAAAATGTVMTTTSVRASLDFKADHPFVFVIQDNSTGNILFVGRISNPAA